MKKKVGEFVMNLKDVELKINKNIWGTVYYGSDINDKGNRAYGKIYFNVRTWYNDKIVGFESEYNKKEYDKEEAYGLKKEEKESYDKKYIQYYIARPYDKDVMDEIMKRLDDFTWESNDWEIEIRIDKKDFDYVRKHVIAKKL